MYIGTFYPSLYWPMGYWPGAGAVIVKPKPKAIMHWRTVGKKEDPIVAYLGADIGGSSRVTGDIESVTVRQVVSDIASEKPVEARKILVIDNGTSRLRKEEEEFILMLFAA